MIKAISSAFSTAAEKKKFIINCVILLAVVLAMVLFFTFSGRDTEKFYSVDFSSVDKICELATLRCFYHNVAEYEKSGSGLLRIGAYGHKKLWIEYDGIIDVGIDASRVQINPPDSTGLVRVYVPEAMILGISADEKSLGTVMDTGLFTKISAQERSDVFSKAQSDMKESARTDSSTLTQAHRNAKQLIKQYIISVGVQTGREFTVEWLDEPIQ